MRRIESMKTVYRTRARTWAVELALAPEEDAEEGETQRFDVEGPEHVETLIECFEESVEASFDPESGDLSFTFEPLDFAFEEDEDGADDEDDEDDEDGEEDEDEEGEDQRPRDPASRRKPS